MTDHSRRGLLGLLAIAPLVPHLAPLSEGADLDFMPALYKTSVRMLPMVVSDAALEELMVTGQSWSRVYSLGYAITRVDLSDDLYKTVSDRMKETFDGDV